MSGDDFIIEMLIVIASLIVGILIGIFLISAKLELKKDNIIYLTEQNNKLIPYKIYDMLIDDDINNKIITLTLIKEKQNASKKIKRNY